MIIGLGTSRHARALSLTLAGGMVGALVLTVPASAQPAPVAARPAAAAPSAVRTAAPAATVETGSVSARVQFGSGSAVLTGTAKAALAALVASLPAPAVVTTVTVNGYVQRTSNTANDLALSLARARAAASYLKSLGVGGVYAVAGLRVGGSGASARAATVVLAYRIPRPQTLTFTTPAPMKVGAANQRLVVRSSAGLPVVVRSITPTVCTVIASSGAYYLHAVAAGVCSLRATAAGSSWYFPGYASATVRIAPAISPQTIRFTQPADMRSGDADRALSVTATSGLPVTVVATSTPIVTVRPAGFDRTVCTLVGTPGRYTVHAGGPGVCTLTATQAGNASFYAAPKVVRTFEVLLPLLSQTITFDTPVAMAVGDPDQTLVASSTSGLPVTITSRWPSACTVVNGKLHAVSNGTCSLIASQAGNTRFAAAPDVTVYPTINGQAQTITFTQPAAIRVGGANLTLTATATSGLPVTFVSMTLNVCTVVSGKAHAVVVGTCTLRAVQSGNEFWASAAAVDRTIAVDGTAQTIDFTQPTDIRVGDADDPLAATATSGLAVTFGSSSPNVCTVVSGAVHAVAPGECILTADQAGNSTWAAAPTVTLSITVRAALLSQAIQFFPLINLTVGDGGQPLFVIATSHLAVTVVSESPGVCEVSGLAVLPVGAGTCTLTASQAGNIDYAPAPDEVRTFTVYGQFQSISFTAPANQYVDDPGQTLVATASSGLPVTFTSQTPDVCDVLGDVLVPLTAGRCAIVASQDGDSLWAAAEPSSWSFDLWPARQLQTVSFTQPIDMLMTDDPQGLSASASGLGPVTITSNTPNVCTTNGVLVAVVAAGTCSLTAHQAGDVTYAPASKTVTFTVSRTAQSIDFPQPFGMTVGGNDQTLDYFANSGLPVTLTSNSPEVCTVSSGGTVHAVGSGTCSITASQAGDGTFLAAVPVVRTFTVLAADQTITATAPSTMSVGDADQSFVASAPGGTVTFASTTPAVCTIVNGALHAVSIGTCKVTASQGGNAQYNAAPDVELTSSITGHSQLVDGDPPLPMAVGDADQPIVASATSGLTVTLTSLTPDVCTVVSGNLHAVSAGFCRIEVHQPGDIHYAPSDTIELDVDITGRAQSISFTQPSALAVAGADEALTYSATSGLDVTITSTTLDVCTIVAGQLHAVTAGTCSLTASQAGNGLWAVAPEITHTVQISGQAQTVEFTAPADMTFGDADQAVTTETTSPLAVTLTSDTPLVCDIVNGKIHALAGGTCTVTASQAGSPLWAPATPRSHTITIDKATQGITFTAPSDMAVNAADQVLVAVSSSGLDVTVHSTTPLTCDVVAGAVHPLAMGLCSLRASQAGNAQYLAASSVTKSITITARTLTAQSITFDQPVDVTYGAEPPQALTVFSDSGLVVDVASLTPDSCSVALDTGVFYATALTFGVCTLEATQPGDADFAPATPIDVTFTIFDFGGGDGGPVCPPDCGVQPQDQTISFPLPLMMGVGETQQMGALASSGLDVVYSSATPEVCDVDNTGLVTALGAGICTILADQGGDANYSPAPTASASFEVVDSV